MFRFASVALGASLALSLLGCNKKVDPYAFDAGGAAATPSAPVAAETPSAPAADPSAPAADNGGSDLAPLNAGAKPKPPAPTGAAKPKASAKPAGIPECELAKSPACAHPSGAVLRANCSTAHDTCLKKGGTL